MATVRYLVNDVDAAITFYHGLGFTTMERWGPPFAQLVKGDLELWISGPGTSAARPMPDGAKPVPGGWNRLVITVSDLPALVRRQRGEGHRFRNDIVTGPGGSQILVEDPSGNPLELFEPAKS
jgi:catechol 2,3-dioxygenase-like lactoylglutathione lyase family enzyme